MEAEEDMVEVADSLMVVVDLLNQVEMADSLMVVVEDLLNQVEVAVVEDIEVGLVAAFMTLVESKVVVDLLNQVEVAMDLLNLGDFESSSVFVYVYLY